MTHARQASADGSSGDEYEIVSNDEGSCGTSSRSASSTREASSVSDASLGVALDTVDLEFPDPLSHSVDDQQYADSWSGGARDEDGAETDDDNDDEQYSFLLDVSSKPVIGTTLQDSDATYKPSDSVTQWIASTSSHARPDAAALDDRQDEEDHEEVKSDTGKSSKPGMLTVINVSIAIALFAIYAARSTSPERLNGVTPPITNNTKSNCRNTTCALAVVDPKHFALSVPSAVVPNPTPNDNDRHAVKRKARLTKRARVARERGMADAQQVVLSIASVSQASLDKLKSLALRCSSMSMSLSVSTHARENHHKAERHRRQRQRHRHAVVLSPAREMMERQRKQMRRLVLGGGASNIREAREQTTLAKKRRLTNDASDLIRRAIRSSLSIEQRARQRDWQSFVGRYRVSHQQLTDQIERRIEASRRTSKRWSTEVAQAIQKRRRTSQRWSTKLTQAMKNRRRTSQRWSTKLTQAMKNQPRSWYETSDKMSAMIEEAKERTKVATRKRVKSAIRGLDKLERRLASSERRAVRSK